ncbi:MAG: hypothetical protein ABIU09_05420 [Pyrinomonadaceae bacterium]
MKATKWDAIFTQDGPGNGLEADGSPGWTGGDSTYSLHLPNGDTAFFFSDSYIGEWPKRKGDGTVAQTSNGLRTTKLNCFPPICEPYASIFSARNSIVILSRDRKRLRTLVGPKDDKGLSTSYFKEPAARLNYWIGDAILLPAKRKEKQRILVFLHKFDAKLAFHGAAIAQLNAQSLAVEKLIEVRNLPDLVIHWGTAMVAENGFLYIYGKGARDGKKQVFVTRANVAWPIDELADAIKWTARNGKEWSGGPGNASPIMPAGDSISDEFNIARFSINGRSTYLLAAIDTTVPFGSWRDITLYSSCSPEGPFTGKHFVYAMPESGSFSVPGLSAGKRLKEHLVVYNPHIHSQFSGSGRILISYNINRSNNSDSVYIDGYRPRFVYVPIAGLK